jgi:predicted Zn-dependent peptidase
VLKLVEMPFEKFDLPNGLQVLLLPDDSLSVTVLGLVKAGSRYETLEKEGLAHFYEHMVFKGTRKFPSKKDLALAVDEVGADYNGATDQEYTYYYVKTARKDLEVGLSLVSQLLVEPLLSGKDINVERGVILEELHMYYDVPQYRAQIELSKLLFPGHPLGNSGLGRKETIGSFDQKDFLSFKSRFYSSEKMVLVVAGGIKEPRRVKKEIKRYFFPLKRACRESFTPFKGVKIGEREIRRVFRKTDQVHLAMGVRALSRNHKKRYAQALLNVILGGGMSSRLFQEVREERGLCYSIGSSVEMFNEVGVLGISAGLNRERLDEAIGAIRNQLLLLVDKKVDQKELSKAKQFFEGNLALSLEDSFKKAHFYGKQALLEPSIKDTDRLLKEIRAVEASDIRSVGREIFSPEKVRIALVGNYRG